MKKYTKIVLYFLFSVMLISEFLVIYKYFSNQNNFAEKKKIESTLFETQRKLDLIIEKENWYGRKIPNDVLDSFDSDYFLILIFTQDDCHTCLESVFSELNNLRKKALFNRWEIMAVLSDDSVSKNKINIIKDEFDIKFKLIIGKRIVQKNPMNSYKRSPILLFGESKKMRILYAYYPTPNIAGLIKYIKLISQIGATF